MFILKKLQMAEKIIGNNFFKILYFHQRFRNFYFRFGFIFEWNVYNNIWLITVDRKKCNFVFLLQKQSMMVRQLEEELRLRMRGPSIELQQQMEVLYNENEHLTREIAILRDTIKVIFYKHFPLYLSFFYSRNHFLKHVLNLKLKFFFLFWNYSYFASEFIYISIFWKNFLFQLNIISRNIDGIFRILKKI